MPLDEALPIARQIAEALEAAHEQGIVHRDLKPANIKVRPTARSRCSTSAWPRRSTPTPASARRPSPPLADDHVAGDDDMHGVILGTAAYMAPEQARGKPVDKRADIWAFGCVLYEMLMSPDGRMVAYVGVTGRPTSFCEWGHSTRPESTIRPLDGSRQLLQLQCSGLTRRVSRFVLRIRSPVGLRGSAQRRFAQTRCRTACRRPYHDLREPPAARGKRDDDGSIVTPHAEWRIRRRRIQSAQSSLRVRSG